MVHKKRTSGEKRRRRASQSTAAPAGDRQGHSRRTKTTASTTYSPSRPAAGASSSVDATARAAAPAAAAPTSCPAASSSSISASAGLRSKGNLLYKQVSEGGFGPAAKRAKLGRAQDLYTQALHAAPTHDDRASCCKNLGMLFWLWSKAELKQVLSEYPVPRHASFSVTVQLSSCRFYLAKTVKSLLEARAFGVHACKPQPWIDHIDSVLISIAEWAAHQSSLLPLRTLAHPALLHYLSQAFEDAAASPEYASCSTEACTVANKSYAQALFAQGLLKVADDDASRRDYSASHSLMLDCYLPLQRAHASLALQSNRSLRKEVQELQQSVFVHRCICEAMKAVDLGDKALEEALMNDEEVDMEGVRDALDHYRNAAVSTRELDMETEGIAMSRIGKVYSDVLKLPEKAHEYHFQATRLALTVLSPRVTRASWYAYSLEKVRLHQERVAREEKDELDKKRKPMLEKLESKLDKLHEAANKSTDSFLQYVYTEHPHPDLKRNVVPVVSTAAQTKNSLKKALLHYHPDSNVRFGEEWKTLCEEICKHLTRKYECFKGV